MKTKSLIGIITWLMVIGIFIHLPNPIQAKGIESDRTKEVKHTSVVSQNDILKITNSFGNITVTHWDKHEADIRVVIEVKSKNDKRAEEMINRVKIDLKKSGNKISGITSIGSQNSNNNKNEQLKINYFISIPSYMTIKLEQQFGNIHLPANNEGQADLIVKFGNLNAGNFTKDLKVKAEYSNVTLDNFKNAKMNFSFCGNVVLGSGDKLDMDSKYSTVKANTIGESDAKLSFGKFILKQIDKMTLKSDYSDVDIDKLKNEIEVSKLGFGKLNVYELAKDFNTFKVSANYGNVKVSLSSDAVFSVDARSMQYGSFKMKEFKVTSSDVDTKSYYRYDVNGGSSTRKIDFHGNSFSNIEIKTL